MLRPGQHKDETAMEYLRRVVSNCDHETDSLLDQLPSVDAILDFFDLWCVYDTDLWQGVLDSIADGANPKKALRFVAKHRLGRAWQQDVSDAFVDFVMNQKPATIKRRARRGG